MEKPTSLAARYARPCLRCGEVIELGTPMFPGGVRAGGAGPPQCHGVAAAQPPARAQPAPLLQPPAARRRRRPAQGEEGTRYAHLECAVKWCRDHGRPLVPPTCKHWRMRGYCSFGPRCFYSHPESCLQELARAAAARWGRPPPSCLPSGPAEL
jgi:hypothetical protein